MGQYDILSLLQSCPNKWWTVNQTAKILGLTQSTVSTSFRHLRNRRLVQFEKSGGGYVYRIKS